MTADLEARVAKLERTAKRRGLAVVALAVLCVGLGAAQVAQQDASFGTVKARLIQLVDENGNANGVFSSDGKIVAAQVSATEFMIPGPENRPYFRATTIDTDKDGKRAGGISLADHDNRTQTSILAGREIGFNDF